MRQMIVTPNVIRQALEFMGAPTPNHFKKWSPVLTSENQTSLQQVWLEIDRWQLHKWLRLTPFSESYPRTNGIVAALQECFCADVQVVAATYPPGEAFIEVSLLLVVANDKVQ